MNSHSDVVTFNNTPISREKLIQEQACDSELETYFDQLKSNEAAKTSACFYLKFGVLMRQFSPLNLTGEIIHQIVIPKPLRQ